MRGPRRRESEVRPVRRAQVHLGTNRPPARAAQSFRYHLLHDRSAASGPRSGTGGSYPEGPPRRGDPKAPGGRTGHGGDASPRGTVHAAPEPGLPPQIRRVCEAHLSDHDDRSHVGHREKIPRHPEDRRGGRFQRADHPATARSDHPARGFDSAKRSPWTTRIARSGSSSTGWARSPARRAASTSTSSRPESASRSGNRSSRSATSSTSSRDRKASRITRTSSVWPRNGASLPRRSTRG